MTKRNGNIDSSNSKMKNQDNKDNKNNEFQWKRAGKTSFIWVFILITAIFLSGLFTSTDQKAVEIQYYQYRSFLEDKLISKAIIIEDVFTGELETPQTLITDLGPIENVTKFKVIIPFIDREIMSEWNNYGVDYSFKQQSIDWTGYFLNMLPWLLIIAVWIFILRRMQSGAGGMKGIFNFGKSRAKIWTSDMEKITFNDVAGCVEAKEELKEVIDFLKHPKLFEKLGAKIPRGALFCLLYTSPSPRDRG